MNCSAERAPPNLKRFYHILLNLINYNGKYIVGEKGAIQTLMGLLDIKVPANKEFIEGKGLNQRGKKLQTLKKKFNRGNGDYDDFKSLPEDSLEYVAGIRSSFTDVPLRRKLKDQDVVEENVNLDDLIEGQDGTEIIEEVNLDDIIEVNEGTPIQVQQSVTEPRVSRSDKEEVGELDISQAEEVPEQDEVKTQPVEQVDQEHVDSDEVLRVLSNIQSGNKNDLGQIDEVQQKILKCLGLISG